MQLTEEGLALIRAFEGFRDKAYRCPAGVLTIGYGHTGDAGPPPVTPGMTMSETEARAVLAREAQSFASGIAPLIRVPLNDQQFSALVSFAYNVGLAAFRGSSVLKAVNDRNFDAVARRLQLWVKAGGKELPGLVKRRAAEAALFAGGDAGDALRNRPEMKHGTPPHKSSTVLASIIAALSALISAWLGSAAGQGHWTLPLGAAGVSAALWVMRERLRHAREDGL